VPARRLCNFALRYECSWIYNSDLSYRQNCDILRRVGHSCIGDLPTPVLFCVSRTKRLERRGDSVICLVKRSCSCCKSLTTLRTVVILGTPSCTAIVTGEGACNLSVRCGAEGARREGEGANTLVFGCEKLDLLVFILLFFVFRYFTTQVSRDLAINRNCWIDFFTLNGTRNQWSNSVPHRGAIDERRTESGARCIGTVLDLG
jgi:hypothetical protein